MSLALTMASYLAENARPVYERIAAHVDRRLGGGAELISGVGWEERLRMSGIDSTVLELELSQRAEIAGAFRVVESIGPEPIPPVVVASRLSGELKGRLLAAFLTMHEDPEGRVILREGLIARFVSVKDPD